MKSNIQYISGFGGMNQRQDLDKIGDNQSPLLVNISLDKPGTWKKRKGSDLLGSTLAGTGIDGAITYYKSDNSAVLRKVAGGNLYIYNDSTDTWSSSISSGFTSGYQAQAVNYLDRVYWITLDNYLSYENGGGTLTEVGSGSDRIKGQAVGVAQDTLFVMTADKVYYSAFDSANNVPTHQLWNDSEGDLASSTRFINLLEYGRGLHTYQNLMYMWTYNACYRFNMQLEASGYAVEKVCDIGLAGPRAVTTCNGYLVWMSPDGRVWVYGGAGVPQPASWAIEDDESGEATINSISPNNIPTVAAGSDKNKFYFYVGDTSFHGETISNTMIVGHIPQSFNTISWSLYSYPWDINIFVESRFSNQKVSLFGVSGVNDMYQMGQGVNDGTTAVQATAKTKFVDFETMMHTKEGNKIYVKYRPQSADNTYLRVRYALDSNYSYTSLSDPDAGTPVTKYSIIDMYDSDTNALDDIDYLQLPSSKSFRSISIEFGNLQADESFEISALGYKIAKLTEYDKRLQS